VWVLLLGVLSVGGVVGWCCWVLLNEKWLIYFGIGAVSDPQLLMLSGIGPAATLKSLNIPVVQDLPGVGQNLMGKCYYSTSVQSRFAYPKKFNNNRSFVVHDIYFVTHCQLYRAELHSYFLPIGCGYLPSFVP